MDTIPQRTRDLIVARSAAEQSPRGGTQKIQGPELSRIQPLINEIPNEDARKRIEGLFKLYSKFGALSALIAPEQELLARYPDHVAGIVDAAVAADLAVPNETSGRDY